MKNIVLMTLVLAMTPISFAATAAKKKKVMHSQVPAPAARSQAKLEDAQTPQKRKLSASLEAWIKDLKKRMGKANAQNNQLVAVAAVRGAETPDAPPLYWKGKNVEGKVPPTEFQEFEAAVNTVSDGDETAAREKLNAFLAAHPDSALKADAQETLTQMGGTAPANP